MMKKEVLQYVPLLLTQTGESFQLGRQTVLLLSIIFNIKRYLQCLPMTSWGSLKFSRSKIKFLEVRSSQKEQNQRGQVSQILLNLRLQRRSRKRLKLSRRRKMLNGKIPSHQKNITVCLIFLIFLIFGYYKNVQLWHIFDTNIEPSSTLPFCRIEGLFLHCTWCH